jgi:hypothetical protein
VPRVVRITPSNMLENSFCPLYAETSIAISTILALSDRLDSFFAKNSACGRCVFTVCCVGLQGWQSADTGHDQCCSTSTMLMAALYHRSKAFN